MTDIELKEYMAETARQLRELKEQDAEYRAQRERDHIAYQAQREKERTEYEKQRKRERAEYERQRAADQAEAKRRHAELERVVKEASSMIGNHSQNVGSVTEERYYRAFEEHPYIGEITFDIVNRDITLPGRDIPQMDIVLLNGLVCGVVEVKFKFHVNDVREFAQKRPIMLSALRGACPREHYLFAIASDELNPDVINLAYEHGLVVVRRKGSELIIDVSHQQLYAAS